MELKGKVINFLGDSITEGVGVSCEKNIYFRRIEQDYHLKKANGYGISGTRFAIQNKPSDPPSFDRWFSSRVEEMDISADAVVVFGGTNDYGHGDAPIGAFSDRTADTFYGACHDLCIKLINRYPGKPIVFVTPLHRETEQEIHEKGKERIATTLKTYVDIIKEVTSYYSIPVCDLFSVSGIQPRLKIIKEKFVPDGLHPNDDGHAIIARKLGVYLSCCM